MELSCAVTLKENTQYRHSEKVEIFEEKSCEIPLKKLNNKKVVVVGFGPAGMFASLLLARAGYNPIILERGSSIEVRKEKVNHFLKTGELDSECNVQFGEGGAGTFSDGKLTTGVKDDKCKFILDEFIKAGAPEEIGYLSKPHIGTDNLEKIVATIRNEIISLGGKIHFDTKLIDILEKDNTLYAIKTLSGGKEEIISCDSVVLATGHSARDVYRMLDDKKVKMEQKPFSMGVRIEHKQKDINLSQYGREDITADYKLSHRLKDGRGVYTFCMCPGGKVILSSSQENMVVVNGMSDYKRDSVNSNSAVLVSVNPEDFGSSDVLAGAKLQEKYESKAYELMGEQKAIVQLFGDFLNDKITTELGEITPSVSRYGFGNITEALPAFVVEGIKEGVVAFDKKLKGFARRDAVLVGIETRSSSPVRILREENKESFTIKGLYPCGEGAGYAGGIMSAALDGLKVALEIMNKEV